MHELVIARIFDKKIKYSENEKKKSENVRSRNGA